MRRGSTATRRHAARRATRATSSSPGCSRARSCAARTRGRASRASTSPRRRAAPGVHAVVGPGEVGGIAEEAHFEGARGRRRRGRDARAGAGGVELIEIEWEELEPLLDADEAVARGSRDPGVAPLRARRLRAGARPGGRRRRGRVPTQTLQPQLARDAPVRLRVARRRASTSTSRRSTSGASAATWPRPSACRRTRCA